MGELEWRGWKGLLSLEVRRLQAKAMCDYLLLPGEPILKIYGLEYFFYVLDYSMWHMVLVENILRGGRSYQQKLDFEEGLRLSGD